MKISNNKVEISEHLKLPSKTTSISVYEKFLDDLCSKHKISERCYGNMLIAVTEAVNNAIIHGNQSDRNKEVLLTFTKNNNTVVFCIHDQGPGFEYDNLPDPTDPENLEKLNGRGVFLMKNLADKVEFEKKGTIVKLYFFTVHDEE